MAGAKQASRVVEKCPAHAAVADVDLYDVLYAGPTGENKRKNQMDGAIRAHPDFGEEIIDPDGSVGRRLKPGIVVLWAWSGTGADRVLDVTITGIALTGPRRSALEDFIAASPFAGRIRIL